MAALLSDAKFVIVLLQGIGVSIIRGTGRQTIGAIILFISYCVFALPVGISLMFATHLRIKGE
jgi:multidrug resistance protein, MATE family